MRAPAPGRPPGPSPDARGLTQLIDEMCRAGATDLHIKVPGRPQVRVDGDLIPMPHERLLPPDTAGFAQAVLQLAGVYDSAAGVRESRLAFSIEGLGRFRAQVARQRGTFEIVIHRMESNAPRVEDFAGLEPIREVMQGPPGLVLIGGARKRRAVVAAIIREFNERAWGRLVSIEDPIDWLHQDARASISQREVGTDVASFHEGLRQALRQDADAVAVTDVPGIDDADAVLRAAEEGLHVFAGLPVGDAEDAVLAFVGRFAASREREIAARTASVLRGVVVVGFDGTVQWIGVGAGRRAAMRSGELSLMG